MPYTQDQIKDPKTAKVVRDDRDDVVRFIGKNAAGFITQVGEFSRAADGSFNRSFANRWLKKTFGRTIRDCVTEAP